MCERALEPKSITAEEYRQLSSVINSFTSKIVDIIIRNDLSNEEIKELRDYRDMIVENYLDSWKQRRQR